MRAELPTRVWMLAWETGGGVTPGEDCRLLEEVGLSGPQPEDAGVPGKVLWQGADGLLLGVNGEERYVPAARVLLLRYPPPKLPDDAPDGEEEE